MLIKTKNQSGQSVLELMIAMSVFVLVVSGIMFLVLDAQSANRQGGERTKAAFLTQEAFEATQSIANQGWQKLTEGSYGLDNGNGFWELSGMSEVFSDRFVRQVTIEPVYRDLSGNIVETGGTLDYDTKKITAKTNWDFNTTRPSEIILETYLTNWHSTKWIQTTQTDFNLGTFNNTETTLTDDGEIQLSPSAGIAGYNWPMDIPINYIYDPAKIEMVSSQARLITQGSGINGGTVNGGFDSTLFPWIYSDWDQDGGEVNVSGTYQANGGNPDGNARIRIPGGRNDQVGGYFEQQFEVTENNSEIGTLDFDWSVSSYNGTPVDFEVYAFLDTVSGEPLVGTEIWSSGIITGTTSYASVNLDISSLIASTDTYYFKLAAWVVSDGSRDGRFDIHFDNAVAYWEKTGGVSYPSDDPTIQPNTSLQPVNLVGWVGFTEIATKNGGEIYYQLSHNDGSSWQYWDGGSWVNVSGPTDYNTADVINTNIASFIEANQKIIWKAFLSSDGTQQVILDNVSIQYEATGFSGYQSFGDFISLAHDTGGTTTNYNYINWTIDEPVTTNIQWQLRTADSQVNLSTASWVGPDGTGATYYDTPGQIITTDPGASGIRWMQYRAYLSGDGTGTPIIYDITIDYEK